MRFFISIVFVFFARDVSADLYRWIDPESGSVKYSSYPPPWYGDEAKQKRAPKVEHIPPRDSAPAARADLPPSAATLAEALMTQRNALLQEFAAVPPGADLGAAAADLRKKVETYQALAAELDRLAPRGAEQRRAEARPVLERIAQGLGAQPVTAPPAPRR